MLKMGDTEEAVALLEVNAADHPDSADAAFGLGRAHRTAGRLAAAREEFERALAIDSDHARGPEALAALRD